MLINSGDVTACDVIRGGGWTEGGGRKDGQTKRLHMFSPSVPRTRLVALPHSRVNRFFFSNLSLLLTGTVISGCYGNSHMPNQPRLWQHAQLHTQPSPTHSHYFMSASCRPLIPKRKTRKSRKGNANIETKMSS